MPDYNKEKNFNFKLANLEKAEEFAIWKAWGHKDDVLDPDGNVYKFPIKDGQLTGKDGKVRTMEEIKFLKQADLVAQYENFSRKTSFRRTILINGQEMFQRFSMTSNRELEKQLVNLTNLSINPLDVVFVQKFNQNNTPANMYAIEIVSTKAGEAPTPVVPEQTADEKYNVAPVGATAPPTPVVPQLTDKEQGLLTAVKNLSAPLTEENFMKIAKKNGFEDARSKELFVIAYK